MTRQLRMIFGGIITTLMTLLLLLRALLRARTIIAREAGRFESAEGLMAQGKAEDAKKAAPLAAKDAAPAAKDAAPPKEGAK